MNHSRTLLTGIAAIGIFGIGYLTGQSGKASPSSDTASSSASHASAHKNTPSTSDPFTTRPKPRNPNDNTIPHPEKNFSRRIIAMMSAGQLDVNGVAINSESFLPSEKVKEFLDLTDEQLDTMKQIGREHLQAKQDHERSIAKVLKRTDDEVILDVPADPSFATEQKEALIESIRKEFGPDVAAVLQTSIGQSYGEFSYQRHVRYTITPSQMSVPDGAPPEIRAILEGQRNYRISVNQNEDGTWMTNDQGMMIPGGNDSRGSFNIDDTKPDAFVPRYHYLLRQ